MRFQQRLKEHLAARGMSQVELGRRLGVTHSAVTMILNNKMRLPPGRLEDVLKILKIPEVEREGLRAAYLASVAPQTLRRQGGEMYQAYELLRERADLGDALLDADEAFDVLSPRDAISARQGFYGRIIDTLAKLGVFSRKAHKDLKERLRVARSEADVAWIVARVAIGLVRLRPDATKTKLFSDLRAVLSRERVNEILANAQRRVSDGT